MKVGIALLLLGSSFSLSGIGDLVDAASDVVHETADTARDILGIPPRRRRIIVETPVQLEEIEEATEPVDAQENLF
jgi:hypothetical protein